MDDDRAAEGRPPAVATGAPSTGGTAQRGRGGGLVTATRVIDAIIAPILLAAGIILFFFPGNTHALWAWTIKPNMSALTMGAGYLGGVWFFTRAFLDRHPYRVVGGLAAASPFTAVLLIATIVHWNLFNHRHVSFFAWLILYGVTPVLLPILAIGNWRDHSVPVASEPVLPSRLRVVLASIGIFQVVAALAWIIAPHAVIPHWPWKITPLSLRSVSGFVMFTGVMLAWPLVDPRQGAVRYGLEAVLIGLSLTGVAALRAHDELNGPTASVVGYTIALVGIVVLVGAALVILGRAQEPTAAVP
jgi:hypothetical protein